MTNPGAGIDGTVRRIEDVYDVLGRVSDVESYDNATPGSGNVLNEVFRQYNDFGLMTAEYQEDGPITFNGNTPVSWSSES